MDLYAVLRACMSHDYGTRTNAEKVLNDNLEAQYGQFILALVHELANEQQPNDNRQLVGIYVKNLIHANDRALLDLKIAKWVQCDSSLKEQIRMGCLQTLQSQNAVVAHTAAQVVAAFGAADIPRNGWPNLVQQLLEYVTNPLVSNTTTKAALQAIGYLSDALDSDVVQPQVVNQMLSAIIDGMRSDRPDDIRLAAVESLNNSLTFTEANFNVDHERDVIMRNICEAISSNNEEIRVMGLNCLVTVAEFYYLKLGPYIETLCHLTLAAIRQRSDDKAAQTAIAFWTTVCEAEIEIEEEGDDDVKSLDIIKKVAGALVPVILETLTQQDDSLDDDEMSIAMSGQACLQLVTRTIGYEVVPLTLPFITANIGNSSWHFKEASILAFGTILDGTEPTSVEQYVRQALPLLVPNLRDSQKLSRDSTCWTLGNVFKFHPTCVPDVLALVNELLLSLDDNAPSVCAQACYALHCFAEAQGRWKECSDDTNYISKCLPVLLSKLLAVTNRPDVKASNLHMTAYETINALIQGSASDMQAVVHHASAEALSRLEATLSPAYSAPFEEKTGLQSSLCAFLGNSVQKLEKALALQTADRAMQSLLAIVNGGRSSVAHEDAYMAMGHIADRLGEDFSRYLQHIYQPLLVALQNMEESSVLVVAANLLGDCCRNAHLGVLPYCDEYMRRIIDILQNPAVKRSVKPYIVGVLGDFAMVSLHLCPYCARPSTYSSFLDSLTAQAIEGNFERYLPIVLTFLRQAGEVMASDGDDEDFCEYVNALRGSLLEAYTGVLQGFHASGKADLVRPALDDIIAFLGRCMTNNEFYRDADVSKAVLGTVGDLGQIYGKKCGNVVAFFQQAKEVMCKMAVDLPEEEEDEVEFKRWVKGMIMAVIQ